MNVITSPLAVEPGLHLRAGYGNYTESGFDLLVGSEKTNFAWEGTSPRCGFDLRNRVDRRFDPHAVYESNVDNFTQRIGSITSEFPVGGMSTTGVV